MQTAAAEQLNQDGLNQLLFRLNLIQLPGLWRQ